MARIEEPGRFARTVELDTPASEFHEAFLLGNGSLGATVYGRPGVEEFALNLDTLWSGGPRPSVEGPAAPGLVLAELRKAIAVGDHELADRLARALQGEGWTESYQPIGHLRWRWGAEAEAAGYRRRLDLASAVARVETGSDAMDAFVSAPDGVLVAEATGTGAAGGLAFTSPHNEVAVSAFEAEGVEWLIATGRAPSRVLPNYVEDDHPVRYDPETPDADGTVAAGMGWSVAAARDGDRLIVAAAGGFRGAGERPCADVDALTEESTARVRATLEHATADLRRRHTVDYSALFDRVRLDLSDADSAAAEKAQRYFDFGRYLLISSSRPGTQAANLQGIWNVDVRPGWSANYTTNINVEMNYWGAEVAGLPELHEPLFDLARDLAEAGRATAGRIYGAPGATVHHNTDLWRFTEAVRGEPQWANWQTGLAWIAAHLGDRLDYEWDEDFARSTALPVVREASTFLLDQLVEDTDGFLVVSPSTSPEHRFLSGDTIGTVTAGATIDQELAWQLLDRHVRLAEALGEPADRCKEALARLRLPVIDAQGRLAEWAEALLPSELDHRHLSHLYGAFPGSRITETRTPAEFEAVGRALAYRLEHGSGYTGWSQAWVLCLAARLRDRDLAERAIGVLVEELGSASLLDLHPHDGWPGDVIFQVDGNLGAIAGIAELLLQSHDGAISLLPTLPESWSAGSVSGLRARGDHKVDLIWASGTLAHALIRTGTGGTLVIEVDSGMRPDVTDTMRGTVAVSEAGPAPRGRKRLRWSAEPGRTYEIRVN